MDNIFEITATKGKGKNAVTTTTLYRRLTPDEMKSLVVGSKIPFITQFNEVRQIKVTSVKTWKTRRDVHIGLKYGLYEYSYAEWIPGEGMTVSGEIMMNRAGSYHGEILVTEVREGELNV